MVSEYNLFAENIADSGEIPNYAASYLRLNCLLISHSKDARRKLVKLWKNLNLRL